MVFLVKVLFLVEPPIHLILLHMQTSSFAAVIIITASGGRYMTANVNIGHNKLLAQSTSMFVYLMRAFVWVKNTD